MALNQNIKAFLKALPPNMMSLILFDGASQIIGFAVSDADDHRGLTKIYDSDCREVSAVPLGTTVKDMVDVLIRRKCAYIV